MVMLELKVIDHKIEENNFSMQNDNVFLLLYELSKVYSPELVDLMLRKLMKGQEFNYYFNRDHRVTFSILPVAD